MSHLYKEWHDLMREYTKEQPPVHDRLTEERKRLNKEYALQLSNTVGQNNGEKQDDK